MALRSKRRYHHVKFDEEEEFETPAFQYLNENSQDNDGKDDDSDDDFSLKGSGDERSDDNLGIIEEDDDAPEDVSFKTGKQTALQQMRDAIKNINAEKLRVKEKRRKIDEQFKEQKKRKMEELKKARLPDDFLEGLSDSLSSKSKKTKNVLKNQSSAESTDKGSLQDEEDEGSFADTEDDFDHHDDFIPLESNRLGGVEVQPIKEYQKKTTSLAVTAAEFKYRHLYGNKIQRESSKSRMAKIEKRKCYR